MCILPAPYLDTTQVIYACEVKTRQQNWFFVIFLFKHLRDLLALLDGAGVDHLSAVLHDLLDQT